MLQINSESVQIMLMQIMERFDRIDRTLERMNKLKECLEGDTLLDFLSQCGKFNSSATSFPHAGDCKVRYLLFIAVVFF